MHFLDTVTIMVTGLMAGTELSISAFVNPAIWQLETGPQIQGLSLLARSLGRAMPGWYGASLALLVLESFLHRYQNAWVPLLAAAFIWAVVIVLSIVLLVPINNRIAALDLAKPAFGWKQAHQKWDALHRLRILLLAVALFLLTYALTA